MIPIEVEHNQRPLRWDFLHRSPLFEELKLCFLRSDEAITETRRTSASPDFLLPWRSIQVTCTIVGFENALLNLD